MEKQFAYVEIIEYGKGKLKKKKKKKQKKKKQKKTKMMRIRQIYLELEKRKKLVVQDLKQRRWIFRWLNQAVGRCEVKKEYY